MDRPYNTDETDSRFRAHLLTSINADDLENMTRILDGELAKSQNTMNQIASVFASINNLNNYTSAPKVDPSSFLESEPSKLVTPDFAGVKFEGEIDEILATMKTYADNLKKNLPTVVPQTSLKETILNSEPIDINQYVGSLDQLNKRLAYIRQNYQQEESQRDLDMESKLEILNQNVKLFKEMTEGNSLLSKASTETSDLKNVQNPTSQYEEIINKLLSGINDVTYLRQNKG